MNFDEEMQALEAGAVGVQKDDLQLAADLATRAAAAAKHLNLTAGGPPPLSEDETRNLRTWLRNSPWSPRVTFQNLTSATSIWLRVLVNLEASNMIWSAVVVVVDDI